MEEFKMEMEKLKELGKSLTCYAHEHKDELSPCDMGQLTDMIKDISKAKKDCWEAKYYESIVTAMQDAEEEEEMMAKMGGRMGYDHYRYPSSGRFAPTGSGKRYGYVPPFMMDDPSMAKWDHWMEKDFDPKYYRLGYPSDGTSTSDGKSTGGRMGYTPETSRYGRPYEQFRDARRHYHETRSSEDEAKMSEHAKEHLHDTVDSLRDIWEDATPELRKKMKADLGKLLNELG